MPIHPRTQWKDREDFSSHHSELEHHHGLAIQNLLTKGPDTLPNEKKISISHQNLAYQQKKPKIRRLKTRDSRAPILCSAKTADTADWMARRGTLSIECTHMHL